MTNEWIGVNDSPMPEDGFYLVRCPNYCESGYQIAKWDNNLFSWSIEGDEAVDGFVTHYQSLPEPHK